MSNECSSIVWKRQFGSMTRKLIAARLADHADDEGRGIWPSIARIAAQCDTSERTVQRTLSDFVKEGLLKIVHEGGGGPGDSRRYDFDMMVLKAMPMASWRAVSRETSVSNDDDNQRNKGDTVSPLKSAKGDTVSAKGDTDDKKGCHSVTQTTIEPPIEPSVRGVVARAPARDDEPVSRNIAQDEKTAAYAGMQNALFERGKRVCEAMGIDWSDPHWTGDVFVLTQWDAAGFDFELDVLPTIASVTRGLGHPPDRLSYFTKPIARNHQARLAAPRLAQSGGHPSGTGKSFRSENDLQCDKMLAAIDAAYQEDEE